MAPDKNFELFTMVRTRGFHRGKSIMGLEVEGAYFFGNEQKSFVNKDVQLAGEIHVPE
jgi:hypothetical protein